MNDEEIKKMMVEQGGPAPTEAPAPALTKPPAPESEEAKEEEMEARMRAAAKKARESAPDAAPKKEASVDHHYTIDTAAGTVSFGKDFSEKDVSALIADPEFKNVKGVATGEGFDAGLRLVGEYNYNNPTAQANPQLFTPKEPQKPAAETPAPAPAPAPAPEIPVEKPRGYAEATQADTKLKVATWNDSELNIVTTPEGKRVYIDPKLLSLGSSASFAGETFSVPLTPQLGKDGKIIGSKFAVNGDAISQVNYSQERDKDKAFEPAAPVVEANENPLIDPILKGDKERLQALIKSHPEALTKPNESSRFKGLTPHMVAEYAHEKDIPNSIDAIVSIPQEINLEDIEKAKAFAAEVKKAGKDDPAAERLADNLITSRDNHIISRLHSLAADKDATAQDVKDYLAKYPDKNPRDIINEVSSDNMTTLSTALESGSQNVVDVLERNGASVTDETLKAAEARVKQYETSTSSDGKRIWTDEDVETAKETLEKLKNEKVKLEEASVLVENATAGKTEEVKTYAEEHPLNINTPNKDGVTPLMAALSKDTPENRATADALSEAGAVISADDIEAAEAASKKATGEDKTKVEAFVQKLQAEKVAYEEKVAGAFSDAIDGGKDEDLDRLLDRHLEAVNTPDKEGFKPLTSALYNDNDDMAKKLRDAGARVTQEDIDFVTREAEAAKATNPTEEAAIKYKERITALPAKIQTEYNTEVTSDFVQLAIDDDKDIGHFADKHPEALNRADDSGTTPLMYAIREGSTDAIETLEDKGATITQENIDAAKKKAESVKPDESLTGDEKTDDEKYVQSVKDLPEKLEKEKVKLDEQAAVQSLSNKALDGDKAGVAEAIEKRPDLLSKRDTTGFTPLMNAYYGDNDGNPDTVAYLKGKGAVVTNEDIDAAKKYAQGDDATSKSKAEAFVTKLTEEKKKQDGAAPTTPAAETTPKPPAETTPKPPAETTPKAPAIDLSKVDLKVLHNGMLDDEKVLNQLGVKTEEGKHYAIGDKESKAIETAVKSGDVEQSTAAAQAALASAKAFHEPAATLRNAARMLRDKNSTNDREALELATTAVDGLEKTEKLLAGNNIEFVKRNLSDKMYAAADKAEKNGGKLDQNDVKALDESIRKAAEPGAHKKAEAAK